MIRKQMSVETLTYPILTYTPLPGTNFESIVIVIPPLPDHDAEDQFRNDVHEKIQDACGNTTCKGDVSLSTAKSIIEHQGRIVIGATIVCPSIDCPLSGPGSSGDREPLTPRPNNPSLYREAEVPS